MNEKPVIQFRIPLPFEAAERAVRDALQQQGFGILTEVDVTAVLRAKLGVETPPQKLLGACNPQIAHQSMTAEPTVAAFLPCGLALRQGASEDETLVFVQNPALLAEAFGVPALAEPSAEAARRLRTALESVGTPA
jgi:uncharacterized protein (DUF302 family)